MPATDSVLGRSACALSDNIAIASEKLCEPANAPVATDHSQCASENKERHPSVRRLSTAEQQILNKYQSHDLSQLKNAALMDRVDTKFVIPRHFLRQMLSVLRDEYSALEIDGKRVSLYVNAYYDTPEYTHYLNHHNRRANRFKLRKRTYSDSEIAFLELKFKNNRGRTVKTRQPVGLDESGLETNSQHHINESGLTEFELHRLMQNSSYNRIALANEEAGERITIDLDLHIQDLATKKQFEIGDWMIVEVKQDIYDRNTTFFKWAKSHSFRACSFSKYCMGLYYTGPEHLKRNNFHKINRQISVVGRKFSDSIAKQPSVY